jgi:hypothetical protein
MTDYMYSAWFLTDGTLDIQDREWALMFIVAAGSEETAVAWGDYLVRRHLRRHPWDDEQFLRSYVEPASKYAHCNGFDETERAIAGDESCDPFW